MTGNRINNNLSSVEKLLAFGAIFIDYFPIFVYNNYVYATNFTAFEVCLWHFVL